MQVQVAERNGDPGATAVIACADPAEWQCPSTPMAALGGARPVVAVDFVVLRCSSGADPYRVRAA